jgi:hypothetical protein
LFIPGWEGIEAAGLPTVSGGERWIEPWDMQTGDTMDAELPSEIDPQEQPVEYPLSGDGG